MTGIRVIVIRALASAALCSVPLIREQRAHPHQQRAMGNLLRALMGRPT